MSECIETMAEAFKALTQGEALLPLRSIMWLPDRRGALGMMPSYLGDLKVIGLKALSVFSGNQGTEYDAHQGAILLFEIQHGQLLAIIDAGEITAIRTAAVSGLATRLLAHENASELAILGSGRQARTHLEAMLSVRSIGHVRVWSRNLDHARRFAERESRRHGVPIAAVGRASEAVAQAQVICTATAAEQPVLQGDWIMPGAHINAVGSSTPLARELDSSAVARSRLFVDRRESALNEAGDFWLAKKEGAINDDYIRGELGEVLLGRVQGRTAATEITLFKSVGLAIEDLAAAYHVYKKAREEGVGVQLELGGGRR